MYNKFIFFSTLLSILCMTHIIFGSQEDSLFKEGYQVNFITISFKNECFVRIGNGLMEKQSTPLPAPTHVGKLELKSIHKPGVQLCYGSTKNLCEQLEAGVTPLFNYNKIANLNMPEAERVDIEKFINNTPRGYHREVRIQNSDGTFIAQLNFSDTSQTTVFNWSYFFLGTGLLGIGSIIAAYFYCLRMHPSLLLN